MKYTWIVLALAGLDQGIKQNIEDQEDQTLPRDLPKDGFGCIKTTMPDFLSGL